MRAALILIASGLCISANAQNLNRNTGKPIASDEVQKAIDEFNRLKSESDKKANEVIVILDPPAPIPDEDEQVDTGGKPTGAPVLVTGKPTDEPETESAEAVEEIIPEQTTATDDSSGAQPTVEPGLEVRVESISKGSGKIDPSKIKLRARFPAKPLSVTPGGWLLEKSTDAPPVVREIELQPGTVISLEISPHLLVPEADGATVFAVNEPGFKALDGYTQKRTVSAILAKSVSQLDEDAKQLGAAISELQQILTSLPKPKPAGEELKNP